MEEKNPLAKITEAIAYLISGTFVIEIISKRFELDLNNSINYSIDWLVLVFGVISVIAAFLYVLYAIPKDIKFIKTIVLKTQNYLLIILFPITIPQIIPVLFDYKNIEIPKITGIAVSAYGALFLLVTIAVLLLRFWYVIKEKKKSIERLVVLSISIVFTTIIRIFQGANRTDTIIFLSILFVLLVVTLRIATRKDITT